VYPSCRRSSTQQYRDETGCNGTPRQGYGVSANSYLGYGLNAVDAKNRLSVPASFRDVLTAKSGGKQVLVGPGHAGRRCLMAFDTLFAEQLHATHEARHSDTGSREAFDERAYLFGSAQPHSIDDAGRIVLSPVLRRVSGITSHVWFVGGFDYFELWDPWAFKALPGLPELQRIQIEMELETRGLPIDGPIA
jgi:MraZ protein